MYLENYVWIYVLSNGSDRVLSLVISLIPLGLWQSKKKKRICGRLYEIKYFFLKDSNPLRVSKTDV